jgi:hypothetical protein
VNLEQSDTKAIAFSSPHPRPLPLRTSHHLSGLKLTPIRPTTLGPGVTTTALAPRHPQTRLQFPTPDTTSVSHLANSASVNPVRKRLGDETVLALP